MRYQARDLRCPTCAAPPGQSCRLVREDVVYWELRSSHRGRSELARRLSVEYEEQHR
jgi:hypothetical protein